MKCIICRKEIGQDILSDEHVIPDSIGGYYHIYNVCKECNSYLGSEIDSKLVNHYLALFMRYSEGLKGKTGKIPNPFDGTHCLDDDHGTKVKMMLDEKGMLIPYFLPSVSKEYYKDHTEIKITLDKKDISKRNQILNKVLKRKKLDNKNYKIVTETHRFKPKILMRQKIDIKEFKIGLLKIAYEFAVNSIEEYFNDESAIEISNFLLNPNYNKIDDYFIGDGLQKEILKPFELIFDFEKKRHLLILVYFENIGLMCIISLYHLFNIAVKLSSKKYLNNNILVGLNDIENMSFKMLSIFDIIKSISEKSIQYKWSFKTQEDCYMFLSLENSRKLEYYKLGDKLPCFDINNQVLYSDVDELIDYYISNGLCAISYDNFFIECLIEPLEAIYLKILPVNKYFQVIGIRLTQKLKKQF